MGFPSLSLAASQKSTSVSLSGGHFEPRCKRRRSEPNGTAAANVKRATLRSAQTGGEPASRLNLLRLSEMEAAGAGLGLLAHSFSADPLEQSA